MNEAFALLGASCIVGFGFSVGCWWFDKLMKASGCLGEWIADKIYGKKEKS